MELRDYQIEAVQSVFDYYISGNTGNPIISAATGAGKSLIIGSLVKRIMTEYASQRILMCTHVKELIQQNFSKIVSFWPSAPVGIYSAGIGKKQPWADIVCAGIQSCYKKAYQLGHRDFIFIDECHLLSPSETGMYTKLIKELKEINPYLKVIGFTATPWRSKGGSLVYNKDSIFTETCYEIGIGELVKRGYLAPLISKSSIIQANMAGVKITAGEFNLKQAEQAIDQDKLTKAALDEVESLAIDRKFFLFFCAGINHSLHIKEELLRRGWEVAVITCDTPKEERAYLLKSFKNSTTRKALINNAVLTTGTDLPNIDCIVLLRATASSVLYIQMLGRGMRLSDGKKNCLVLDYAGNIERFGAVDLIRPPSPPKEGDKSLEQKKIPQKICGNCREPVLIALKECPSCGFIFPLNDTPGHDTTATTAAIMASEIKPERHEVTKILYASHIAKSGIPSLRVSYYDVWGFIVSEYVCFSHTGYARTRAELWHKARNNILSQECPKDVEEALCFSANYTKPIAIYTKKSGKYREVTGYEF